MARRTVILLPPSEGKAAGGDLPPWQADSMVVGELDAARRQVIAATGRRRSVAAEPTMAAIYRYTGVLCRELDPGSLPATARRRLERQALIVSGLWGLVAPTDPIPDYRQKMSSRVEGLGKLSTWWRPQITDALRPRVKGALVWDLLPIEHAAAIEWTELAPRQRVTGRFIDGSGKTVSHWNKLLKGALVRWLVTTGATAVDQLTEAELPQGYRYDQGATVVEGSHTAIEFRAR